MKAYRGKISKGRIWLFFLSFCLASASWTFLPFSLFPASGTGRSFPPLVSVHSPAQITALFTPTTKPTPTYKACHICGDEPAELPRVQAVLFWMATCGHCKVVLTEVLPPLEQKYSAQLEITKIEVSTMEDFDRLYQIAALYNIPKENVGVPFLVIGERVLIGSRQIPQELPTLIDDYLAQGGVDIPQNVSILIARTAVETPSTPHSENILSSTPVPSPDSGNLQSTPTVTPISSLSPAGQTSSLPQGFYLAALLEIGLLVLFLWSLILILSGRRNFPVWQKPGWLVLFFILVGFSVALYLAYVELAAVEAVCGPIGDCNAVQQSPYSRLFGILPLGVVGLAAYVVMFFAWLQARFGSAETAPWAGLALFVMALIGVGFSIYLTYLELFILRAVCAWCLVSALMMGLILAFTTIKITLPKGISSE